MAKRSRSRSSCTTTVLLLCVTVLPYITGMSGKLYLVGAVLLGLGFLYYALKLKFAPAPGLADGDVPLLDHVP